MIRFPALAACLIAFLVVALLLVGYAVLESANYPGHAGRAHAMSDFRIVLGTGDIQRDRIVIDPPKGGRTILSVQRPIADAAEFGYLKFDLAPLSAGEGLPLFFWRRVGIKAIDSFPLEENPLDIIELKRLKNWKSAISEYGFIFDAGSGQSYELAHLSLQAVTAVNVLQSMLSDWLEFEIWQQHSVNYVKARVAASSLPLLWVVVLWSGLGIVFYLLLAKFGNKAIEPKQLLFILLAGWLVMDARWLYNLMRQGEITQHLYWGKTEQQKYMAGTDAAYYAYAERLKSHILPAEPAPVFIIHDKPAGNVYHRVKLQYLLAPHNIFNQDQAPREEYARVGGYILVLKPTPGVVYDQQRQMLQWGRSSLPAELVDQDPIGYLFRLRDIIQSDSNVEREISD